MTGKIFLKLITGVFCVLLLALVTVDYCATKWRRTRTSRTEGTTDGQRPDAGVSYAGARRKMGSEDGRAMAQAAGGRITVVRSDGKVLVDSDADAGGNGKPP